MKEAVVVGAGSVGRGFIGQVLCEAGYHVTFVDVSPVLVESLSSDGSYPHVTVSSRASVRTVVGPVSAVSATDASAVVDALVGADVAATAVGASVLPRIAGVVARSVARRMAAGRPPLNLLLCENLHAAGQVMRDLVSAQPPHLPPDELDANLGLVETSIGRMIPVPEASAREPTVIYAEPYKLLPYDAAAVRGGPIDVPGLVGDPAVPFAYFGDRKLHLHNLGHAMTAYLGELVGATLVADAIALPELRLCVRSAMVESALALSLTYGRPLADLLDHVDDLIHRFGNRALGDTVERVGRDPLRKMAADDRLLGPYLAAVRLGVPSRFLSLAVAAGADALRRHEGWSDTQVAELLDSALSVAADGRDLLDRQLELLADQRSVQAQVDLIDSTYEPSRIL